MFKRFSSAPFDRPVVVAGTGRCGTTLLQSILNTNPDFLIWGEHNGFLNAIASAFYDYPYPPFPDRTGLSAAQRIQNLRDPRHWTAWHNLCGETEFRDRFRTFIRSFFADPAAKATRWGFKEIRYGQAANDHALNMMFECFPETRLIVLVREPEATIFSMLSRWNFEHQREGNIETAELDRLILEAAQLWGFKYRCLAAVCDAHPGKCLQLRYEDLGDPQTFDGLAKFLETSSFDWRQHLGKVKDASQKTDATAVLIRRRMEFLQPQITMATEEMRSAYGYPALVGKEETSAAG